MKNYILVFLSILTLSVSAQKEEFSIAEGVTRYVDLFNTTMEDGVSCYRIPSIVTAPNGDIIATIDERVPSCSDLKDSKDINIAIRRSSNNGKSWTSIEIIVDFPLGQSASDPSMIVDNITKEIFLFYNYMDLDKEKDVYYLHVVKSADNGKTWSKPEDITSQISKPEWHKDFKFITSGRGIQTSIDTPISPANESKIIELADGTWMVNARSKDKKGFRYVHTSHDEGETWTAKSEEQLIDPGCNASIIRYTSIDEGYKKNRLLFSNANSVKGRVNMTVKISYDEGKTWPVEKIIYEGGSAYSSLTILENGDIGLFFEQDVYKKNPFVSFSLKWLTDGDDKYKKPKSLK